MTLYVKNSPFSEKQAQQLNDLLKTLDDSQKMWLSGYLTALVQNEKTEDAPRPKQQNEAGRNVTILYGSETGNARGLAEELKQKLQERHLPVEISAMDDYKTNKFKKVEDVLIITATHGEGDPPDNAIEFHEFLHSRKAPKLNGSRFAVLALGDVSYEHFCQTGKDFDKRLEELGAERLLERVDCDVDFEDDAAEWMSAVIEKLSAAKQPSSSAVTVSETEPEGAAPATTYSKKNPYPAEVLENIVLNGRGSNKETRHLELSLEGSGFSFRPGDSIGIHPENDPELVDRIIDVMRWDPEEPVKCGKETLPLRKALLSYFDITTLSRPLVENLVDRTECDKVKQWINSASNKECQAYFYGRDLLDFIEDFSLSHLRASELTGVLRRLPPRLYSIASSHKANPDEVHLTIGTVRYTSHGRQRTGVCSGLCAERIAPGDTLNIYLHPNPNFRFPFDEDTPVIMVGPGTGVAPYRSFLEEREELGVHGKTWLFFGDQHFRTDFLYQLDWLRWMKEGVLTKMDVAFSRDTTQKIYVQHRMWEKRKELYRWLEEGAHLYVCGDKDHMAKDVHETLHKIVAEEGGLSREAAEEYVTNLKKQKRYQRDVY